MDCSKCGAKIDDLNFKFCQYCGSELESEIIFDKNAPNKIKPIPPSPPSYIKEGLFGFNQNFYVLKRNYWQSKSSLILNNRDMTIGRIQRVKKRPYVYQELQETDGRISATFFGRRLKDHEGNLIVEVKKKVSLIINPNFSIEDLNTKIKYKAQVKSKDPYSHKRGFNISIRNMLIGRSIAGIDVSNRIRNITKIICHDHETDRRVILCTALSLTRILLDTNIWSQKKMETSRF